MAIQPTTDTATQQARQKHYPLSLAQRQIWIAQIAAGVTPIYNLLATYHIHGRVNTDLFQQACELTIQQSDVLQTVFVEHSPADVFQYRDSTIKAECDIVKLDKDQSISQWSEREGREPLDLTSKCFRFKLVCLPGGSCVFHFSIHHLVADGGVLQILWQKITHSYSQLSHSSSNPDLNDSHRTINKFDQPLYCDHVANQIDYLESDSRAISMDYWLSKAARPIVHSGYYGLNEKPGYDTNRTYWHPEASEMANIHTALEHPAFNFGSKNKSLFVILATAIIITAAKSQANSHQRLGFPTRSRKEKAFRDALGVYISIGFLDIEIHRNDTVAQVSKKIQEDLDSSMQHLDSSIQSAHITRAFNTSLNIILAQSKQLDSNPVTTVARMNGFADASSAVALHITDFIGDGNYTFMFDLATSVFSEADQARYIKHFQSILSSVLATPHELVANITLLSQDEATALITMGYGGPSKVRPTHTIHDRFAQVVAQCSQNIAVTHANQRITFAELNQRSDALSEVLRSAGVHTGSTVGIYFERSIAAFIAILAVLKSDARFLPLDPGYPKQRLRFMLKDSGSVMLLTQAGLDSLISEKELVQIQLTIDGLVVPTYSTGEKIINNTFHENNNAASIPSAYLMYTSGSTGEPKGVAGTHRATLNRLEWMWSRYPFTEDDVCVSKTALSFVDSIWELFGPLLQGVPTVIFSDSDVLDIFRFAHELEHSRITRMVLVPSLLSVLLDCDDNIAEKLTQLKQVVVSGEPLSSELARRFYEKLDNTNLVNLYGSTEVSGDITCLDVEKHTTGGRISIGQAIEGIQLFVLDEHLQLLPQGCLGEICATGVGLSAGYHNRFHLQLEKFVSNPYGTGKLYKTGDLGRFKANGQLELQGRNDGQLKRFGQRFEAADVEHHIAFFGNIKRCIVGINSDNELYACIEAPAQSSINIPELTQHLQTVLPIHMCPDVFIELSAFPLLNNGKTDRHALSSLTLKAAQNQNHQYEPLTEHESALLSAWREILLIDKIDLTADFFDIGGNSVSAMRIVVSVREAGYDLTLSDILQTGSIRRIAAELLPLSAEAVTDRITYKQEQDGVQIRDQHSLTRTTGRKSTRSSHTKTTKIADSNTNHNSRYTPDNQIEKQLLPIWQTVLKQNKIDVQADFFDIGGNSIAAMQIMVAAKKTGFTLALRDIIELGSLERIATELSACTDVHPLPAETTNVDLSKLSRNTEQQVIDQLVCLGHCVTKAELVYYPLTGAQRGILFHMMMYGMDKPLYGAQGRADLIGEIDPTIFRNAWQVLVNRHNAMRSIVIHEGLLEPVQVVLPNVDQNWRYVDLADMEDWQKHEHRDALAQETVSELINLHQAPLLRVLLIKMSDSVHHFVVDFHHIMFDGWSAASLGEELALAYKALLNDQQPEFDVCGQFKQHVAAINAQNTDRIKAFWKEKLAGFKVPTTISTIRAQSEFYATGNHRLLVDAATSASITALAKQCRVTPNTLIQAAWAILLSRRHHTEDVLYGFAVTGRSSGIQNYESAVGMFVNSLPMRVHCNGASEIKPFLQNLQSELLSLIEYEHSSLADIIQVSEIDAHANLFDSLMVFQNVPAPWDDPDMPYQITNRHNHENSHIPLTIEVFPETELRVLFLYIPEYCTSVQVSDIAAKFRSILETMVSLGPNGLVADIAQNSQAQLKKLTDQFNDTYLSYDKSKSVTDLIWAQANQNPTAVAATYNDLHLNYAQLTQQADVLANFLTHIGVRPNTLVGVCIPRSMDMLISLLAVGRVGAAYVPIDPEYPADRVTHIINDSGLMHIICLSSSELSMKSANLVEVHLDTQWPIIESTPTVSIHAESHRRSSPKDRAYVIYTSGSTGLPKGVMVSNQNVSSFLHAMQEKPGLNADDTLLAVTTVSFDISVLELYLPLVCGARVDIAPQHMVYDAYALAKRIQAESITCMQATPTTWRLLLAAGWQGDDQFKCLVGGEPLPRDLCHELLRKSVELWNMYGPTETTVWSSCTKIENANSVISIGRPIGNTQILILDDNGCLSPINKPGELYIAGDGVSLGYHNRDSLNSEKFIPHPILQNAGSPIFRTGDLARWLDNGEIECLGRIDRQIKLHGHRVEPGEIESILNSIDSVAHCVVQLHKSTLADRLIAYIVLRESSTNPSPNSDNSSEAQLRNTLRQQLPEYMVPAAFVRLSEIPLLPNGKIDYPSLPNPFSDSLHKHDDATQFFTDADNPDVKANKPTTKTQQLLCRIFEKTLQLEQVSIHSNFFDIGGNSLIAMQIVAAGAHNNLDIRIAHIFKLSTIYTLAASIDAPSLLPNELEPKMSTSAKAYSASIGNKDNVESSVTENGSIEELSSSTKNTPGSHSAEDLERIAALLNKS